MLAHMPRLGADLDELVKRALANESAKLRHRYMQRRSFARGMCANTTPYEVHCANVDRKMPHEATLTDAEIGLILADGAVQP